MDSEAITGDDGAAGPRSVGAMLAAARAARGLDLADVARETRVPVRHLAAIEADQHDGLPALPYAIGFVKAFARVVGVDAEAAGARFRAETDKTAHVPVAPAMTPIDERRLPPRGLVVASLAAVLAVVAGVVAWSAGAFDPAPPAEPVTTANRAATATPSPAATVATPAAATPAPAEASPATVAAAAPATATPAVPTATAAAAGAAPATAATGAVVITATNDAWIRITAFDPAAGKVVAVKTGVLAKGERYVAPPTPGLRLWTGRAGALAITVDGVAVRPLGGPVETVKNVSLDAADLRARGLTVNAGASTHVGG